MLLQVFGLFVQYQSLPRPTGFYCTDGPFDFVGIPSGLMTLNRAFVRLPDGRFRMYVASLRSDQVWVVVSATTR